MAEQEFSSITIKWKKNDRTFVPGDKIEGVIVMNAYKGWSHKGLKLVSEGRIRLSTQSRGIIGLSSSFSGKTIDLSRYEAEVCPPGNFPHGITEIPFSFILKALPNCTILETYHGVFCSIIYSVSVSCERGMMKKDLMEEYEFIVNIPTTGKNPADSSSPRPIDISPETLDNVDISLLAQLPKFKIKGAFHKSTYSLAMPCTGEITIESTSVPIRSIELQLCRCETLITSGTSTRETTEVQNIQICDGNVCTDIVIPMYCVLPRMYTCPTNTTHPEFKIEFEMNVVILFVDGFVITESYPLILCR
jgi:hypothetical protein